jgi:photosynthetic reaction center H subunit
MRPTGFTQYIDVAQIVLYAFWIFFAALVLYLRREDKREGYPLEADPNDRPRRIEVQGFPSLPKPKIFRLDHGAGTVSAPGPTNERADLAIRPRHRHPGSPMVPTGDPMQDGVGPASYALRADRPDLTLEGAPKIVPLRTAAEFFIPSHDPNPIGLPVHGADGRVGGKVCDVWIDLSEPQVRYIEVETGAGQRSVLVPIAFAKIEGGRRVKVGAVLSTHFATAPRTAHPEQVTLREEDRISGYFGGGNLYATPSRQEPLL